MILSFTLSDDHISYASRVARGRSEFSRSRGIKPGHGYSGDRYSIDIVGTKSEMAFSLATGLRWIDGIGAKFRDFPFDIVSPSGLGCQIRATAHPRGGLILHREEREKRGKHPYALGIVTERTVTFPGWQWYEEAAVEAHWECGQRIASFKSRPCYLYPQSLLRPMGELMHYLGVPSPETSLTLEFFGQ
jgi:hypothetical protein